MEGATACQNLHYSLTRRLYAPIMYTLRKPTVLEVTAGGAFCQVLEQPGTGATCVTDGSGNYGENEACTVRVNRAGTLTAAEFDVESHISCNNDAVQINGLTAAASAPVTGQSQRARCRCPPPRLMILPTSHSHNHPSTDQKNLPVNFNKTSVTTLHLSPPRALTQYPSY